MRNNLFKNAFFAFCLLGIAVFSFIPINASSNARINTMLKGLIPLAFALPLAIWFVWTDRRGLYSRPVLIVWLTPCLLVALNNFPWLSWINGKCSFIPLGVGDVLLFATYCLCVSAFEELVFRGVVFSCLIEKFPKNKRGIIYAVLVSAAVFGLAHLANLLSGAGLVSTLVQVGYTTLLGGLFAFALVKVKNIFAPITVHFVYNFCGLLFDESVGLGYGVIWNVPSVIITAVIGVGVGIVVLIAVFRISDKERRNLYERMGISA